MSGFDKVVGFIRDTEWEDLPESVRERALMAFVDNFASLIAGRAADASEIAADYASRSWAGGRSTVFQNGKKVSAEGAAFANATAANALDIDDCGLYTKGHPGAQVFPTALALGEELGAVGKEVLAGMVVGYEVGARIARCWHDFYETYRARRLLGFPGLCFRFRTSDGFNPIRNQRSFEGGGI
ncbi:MAG: MmgE/PrpD family protein [Candidatus Bipolaricaulota bacterium]|nr:MmgE/PrpD family protein [Candidatus Bipolaricaulota bacterium]